MCGESSSCLHLIIVSSRLPTMRYCSFTHSVIRPSKRVAVPITLIPSSSLFIASIINPPC